MTRADMSRPPSGDELAQALREMLPAKFAASYDDYVGLFADDDGHLSRCGALSGLTSPFRAALDGQDFATIGRLFSYLDDLARTHQPASSGSSLGDDLENGIIVCFFESVLPVSADVYEHVVPLIGPYVRAYAEDQQGWWLQPEPDLPVG